MAVSILLQPQFIAPVYNPIVVVFSGTSNTLSGFNYVVKIKDSKTNQILNTKKLPPDLNGIGVFTIDRLLQTKIENVIQPQLIGIVKSTKNNFNYYLDLSTEYYKSWKFDGYFQDVFLPKYSAFTSVWGYTVPPWNVGDMVRIQGNSTNVDGVYEVLTATTFFTGYQVVFNKKFTPSTVSTGVTFLSNNLKVTETGATTGSYTAFNGALSTKEYRDYTPFSYTLNEFYQGRFLSTLPNTDNLDEMYQIELDSECVVGGFATKSVGNNPNLIVNTYSKSNANVGRYKINSSSTGDTEFLQFGVGTLNITDAPTNVIFGNATVFNDDVYYYSVKTQNQSNFDTSRPLYFKIKSECSKHPKWKIIFADSMGAYIPFNFNFGSKRTVNINRKQVGRLIGKYDPGTSTYQIATNEREKATIASNYLETVTVNSGWITENESEFLKQLFITNDAYLVEDETYNWIAISITNTSYDFKTTVKDRLFNISLTFTYSVSDSSQASI